MSKATVFDVYFKVRHGWNKHPYFRLFSYIVVTSLVLYWQFIFGNVTFVFRDVAIDTYQHYLKVYEFFADAIKNCELTSYTFQHGFGNSIFSMIDYISDPFSMLGVVIGVIFGAEYIYDSMVFIIILKHICAGLICLEFLQEFKFSLKSSMIAAYIYAFNGYITTLGEHYFFANNPVYLILILFMLEKVIRGEHKVKYWCGLLYTSVLVTMAGVTTAYEILLAAGFYTLFRVTYIYGKNIKNIFQRLGICLIFVLGGIGISSFILMPAVDKILGSTRIAHSTNLSTYFAFSDYSTIKTSILRFFSNQLEGTFNDFYGAGTYYPNVFACFFTVMLVPMAAQFIYHTFKRKFTVKDKIFRMIPVCVVIFYIIDDFVPYFFSFFVGHYQSYAYIFLPMYAVLFAEAIDNVKKGIFSRRTNFITVLVSVAVIVWGGATSYNNGAVTSFMWLMFVAIMLIFGAFSLDLLSLSSHGTLNPSDNNKIKKTAAVALVAVVSLNMFCENYITTYYNRELGEKELVHSKMLTTDIVNNINSQEKDNFFRMETNYYEGRMLYFSYPLMFPMRATAYYDTSLNNFVLSFYQKMFDSKAEMHWNHYFSSKSKVDITVLEDILGLKYLLLTADPKRDGWEKIEEYPEQGVALYQNMGINSAGLFFDSYVTQEKADEMTFDERAIGLGTRLVIDDPAENIDEFALKHSDDNDLNNNLPSAIISDSFSMYNGSIDNVELTDAGYHVRATMNTNDSNLNFALNSDIINNRKDSTQITFKLKDNSFVKNIVYLDFDGAWKEIPVTPQNVSNEWQYTLIVPQTALGLALCVNQPCELDVTVSSKTVASTYINEGIKLDNPKRGNLVTGTVNAQKNSLLYLPIPFDKYWNAYIDGEKVDIMKANYAFMAVPVTAGQHSVTFIYSNKTYHTFRKVSIAAFILYNGFFAFCLIVKYRRKKKGEKK